MFNNKSFASESSFLSLFCCFFYFMYVLFIRFIIIVDDFFVVVVVVRLRASFNSNLLCSIFGPGTTRTVAYIEQTNYKYAINNEWLSQMYNHISYNQIYKHLHTHTHSLPHSISSHTHKTTKQTRLERHLRRKQFKRRRMALFLKYRN